MSRVLSEGSSIIRAAFYGRYSSTMQRLASLEDQKRTCTKDADGAGWIVLEDHCYTDAAKSGTSTHKRGGFQALSKALEQKPKPFDYVLIDDTSRCSRKPQDIMDFVELARHHHIGVRFVAQNLDTVNPQFDLMLQLHAMIDKQYIDRLSVISALRCETHSSREMAERYAGCSRHKSQDQGSDERPVSTCHAV
jgi:site-specific DNA recombinase